MIAIIPLGHRCKAKNIITIGLEKKIADAARKDEEKS